MPVWYLSEQLAFPHPLSSSNEGVLAIGGDLSLERLKLAYAYGIFPWYTSLEPILWWFPDPRCVLKPDGITVSKSMLKLLRQPPYTISFDTVFDKVIEHCRRTPRKGQSGTWIQPEMVDAYIKLHEAGYAHSVEIWKGKELVGGLYGVAYGKIFFGESMFSLAANASKYALISLAELLEQKAFWLIDCQQDTPHMRSMGAGLMSARDFHQVLKKNRLVGAASGKWT